MTGPCPGPHALGDRVTENLRRRSRSTARAHPANEIARGTAYANHVIDTIGGTRCLLKREGLIISEREIDEAPILKPHSHGRRTIDCPHRQVDDEWAASRRSAGGTQIAAGHVEQRVVGDLPRSRGRARGAERPEPKHGCQGHASYKNYCNALHAVLPSVVEQDPRTVRGGARARRLPGVAGRRQRSVRTDCLGKATIPEARTPMALASYPTPAVRKPTSNASPQRGHPVTPQAARRGCAAASLRASPTPYGTRSPPSRSRPACRCLSSRVSWARAPSRSTARMATCCRTHSTAQEPRWTPSSAVLVRKWYSRSKAHEEGNPA
jgi:hypothetical protein